MNHQPYNAFIKNLARQVVDIDEANPRLSKILKLSHFLMPKHVPNVALPCESALYKFIHPPTTSLTTHLSKIRPRQVVDIGEANLMLSKFLKLSHFLMPKHVPNVVAITCSHTLVTSATYKFIHQRTRSGSLPVSR